jgi:hypothetical protein
MTLEQIAVVADSYQIAIDECWNPTIGRRPMTTRTLNCIGQEGFDVSGNYSQLREYN